MKKMINFIVFLLLIMVILASGCSTENGNNEDIEITFSKPYYKGTTHNENLTWTTPGAYYDETYGYLGPSGYYNNTYSGIASLHYSNKSFVWLISFYENTYFWTAEMYLEEKIYEVVTEATTSGCIVEKMERENKIVLSHPVVEGKYIYKISFTLNFVRELNYSQDYTLTCEV